MKYLYDDILQSLDSVNWLKQVKQLLVSLGFGNPLIIIIMQFMHSIKMCLSDQYLQHMFCLQYVLRIYLLYISYQEIPSVNSPVVYLVVNEYNVMKDRRKMSNM